jgi:hypothetical protein
MPELLEDKLHIDYDKFKTPEELEAYLKYQGRQIKITKKYPVVITPKGITIDMRGQNINSRFKETVTDLASGFSSGVGAFAFMHYISNLIR